MDDLIRRNFGPNADKLLVNQVVAKARTADPKRAVGILESERANGPALVEFLSSLPVPVYAMNPDFKPNDRESLEQNGIQLEVVPDSGHFVMLEAPDEFNKVLAGVLLEL